LGAEDYVVKPFHLRELILRVRNGLKRAQYVAEELVTKASSAIVGKAVVHFLRFEAELDGKMVLLTHKETAMLKLMVERRGCVVSRDEILDRVWSEDEFPTPRTVDNFIMRLRRLVELNPEEPEVIKSIRGVGYQLI
jgi:DNA-binding response OmpR family regulator